MNTQEKFLDIKDTSPTTKATNPLHKRIFVLEENLTEKESFWILGTLIFLSGFVDSIVDFFFLT